jgi:hypothetical protein
VRLNAGEIRWTENSLQELERLLGGKIEIEIGELEESLGGLDFPWPITIKSVASETDTQGRVWVNLIVEFDEINGAGAYEVRMSVLEDADNYEMGVPRAATWTGPDLSEYESGLNTWVSYYTSVDAAEIGNGQGLIAYSIDSVGTGFTDIISSDIYIEKVTIDNHMTISNRALIDSIIPTDSRSLDVILKKVGSDRFILIVESERYNGPFPNAVTDYTIRLINSSGTNLSEETKTVGFKYNSRPQVEITDTGEIFIASVVDDLVYSFYLSGDTIIDNGTHAMPTMTEPDTEYFSTIIFDNYYVVTELTPTNIKYHVASRSGADITSAFNSFQPDVSLDYRYLNDGLGYIKSATDKVIVLGVRYEQVGEPSLDAMVLFELSCVSGTISIDESKVEPLIYKGSTLPYYTSGHSVSTSGLLKKIATNTYLINYRIDETGGDVFYVKHILKDPFTVGQVQSHANMYGMGATETNSFQELNNGDYYFKTLVNGFNMVSYTIAGTYVELLDPRTYYIREGFMIFDTVPEAVS